MEQPIFGKYVSRLKQSIEKITIRFIGDLTKSFSESSTGWTYTPDLAHDAFKELAVSFEDALGRSTMTVKKP